MQPAAECQVQPSHSGLLAPKPRVVSPDRTRPFGFIYGSVPSVRYPLDHGVSGSLCHTIILESADVLTVHNNNEPLFLTNDSAHLRLQMKVKWQGSVMEVEENPPTLLWR